MKWTIQRALLALSLVGGGVAFLVGAVGYYNAASAAIRVHGLVRQTMAIRQAMQADMMHDALRADVLRAIFVARNAPQERDATLADVVDHIAEFRGALAGSAILASGVGVQRRLKELQPALVEYLANADTISRLAFRDRLQAERRYPEFQAAFERLEVGIGAFGDSVQANSATQERLGIAADGRARSLIIGFVLIGAALAIVVGRGIGRGITTAVQELLRASRAAGEGDLSVRAVVASRNELGEAAEALNHAVAGMGEALGAERVDWQEVGAQRAEVVRMRQLVENAPINIMYADLDLTLNYMNPAARDTFRSLQAYLPVNVDTMLGRSIDIFHRDPSHQRKLLADPKNLPYQARFQVGPETLDFQARAIRDEGGAHVGAMVTWEVVTGKLAAEQKIKDAQARELRLAEERRAAEQRESGQREREAAERETDQRRQAETERAQAEELRRRVDAILAVVEAAGRGDLTQAVPVTGDDAVGRLGSGLECFLTNLRVSIGEIALTSESVAAASHQVRGVGERLGTAAGETAAQAQVVAGAADEVSRNVQTVAAGTEEMTASIREIARNAADAARVAHQAVKVAERTNGSVGKLGESSVEIGKVIKVITSIAQQTNLLALNATIEAARAGEAGKGFAVVANEVKELAKETARATEEIGRKIETIQVDTRDAVDAICEITEIIAQINSIQTTIAGAVEEQTATTNEMSRNVSEAARGAQEIAQNVQGVARTAVGTSEGATQSQGAAAELAHAAQALQALVSRFQIGSKSGSPARAGPMLDLRRTTTAGH